VPGVGRSQLKVGFSFTTPAQFWQVARRDVGEAVSLFGSDGSYLGFRTFEENLRRSQRRWFGLSGVRFSFDDVLLFSNNTGRADCNVCGNRTCDICFKNSSGRAYAFFPFYGGYGVLFSGDDSATTAHELGHSEFAMPDEYRDYCRHSDEVCGSVMANQYLSHLCTFDIASQCAQSLLACRDDHFSDTRCLSEWVTYKLEPKPFAILHRGMWSYTGLAEPPEPLPNEDLSGFRPLDQFHRIIMPAGLP
jgi:hypothetical protein